MKYFLTTDIGTYVFNAAAKTVTFSGITLTLKQILYIVNVTRGVTIYNPSKTTTNGTFAAGVLTLTFDTTAHANGDELLVVVDQEQADLPVVGTFWQATQPVSGPLTDTELRASAISVSGTVELGATALAALETITVASVTAPLAAGTNVIGGVTQSGTWNIGSITTLPSLVAGTAAIGKLTVNDGVDIGDVTINNASLAVTGTFWQATQPVSGPITDAQIRATPLPVSGTFFQATQPVSLATNTPDVTDRAARLLGVVASIAGALPAGTNAIGTTLGPTLTKGTQGTTGYSIQNLKDAGRSHVMASWEEVAGTAAAESALTNFTLASRGASALGAASSITVTALKTLRIQAISIYVKATSTVNNLARFRLRQAATVANTSPVIFDRVLGLETAGTIAAGAMARDTIEFPDGLEVAAGQQIAFTWFTSANTCTVGLSLHGFEY